MQGLLLADTPADPSSTSSWAAIVLAILTIIYIVAIRPMKKKRDRDPLARQPSNTLLSQQRAIERDMTALLVEYEQMMRTMTAQIDMRTAKLELLLRETDEKLAALKAAEAEAAAKPVLVRAEPVIDPKPAAKPAETLVLAAEAAEVFTATTVAPTAAQSSAPSAPAERLNREAKELKEAAAVLSSPSVDTADPHGAIYELADRGLTYRQIAHQLDRAYGEIELILALRPRAASAGFSGEAGPAAAEDAEESSSLPQPARIHSRAAGRAKHRRKQPN